MYKKVIAFVLTMFVVCAWAQESTMANNQPMVNHFQQNDSGISSSNASSANQPMSPTSSSAAQADSVAGLDASFAQVAELGQQISLASKQIQALQMKKQLAALQSDTHEQTLNFHVLRIEGFGSLLKAVLIMDNGAITSVGPGEKIDQSYRVSLITATTVKVYNKQTDAVELVPFYTGGKLQPATLMGGESTQAPSAGHVPVQSK